MIINNLHRNDTEDTIFIPYNTPSSKNSKEITSKIKDGYGETIRKAKLRNSELVVKYKRNTKNYYSLNRKKFEHLTRGKPHPLHIEFTFIRDSKRKFDYINAAQIVCDLMQEYKWITDDDANHVKPIFADYRIDKKNAGVIIRVL